jgi:hypothetical protein
MANVYRTNRGKMVDIDKVKLVNETAIAVGNMRVNSRGDQLGVGSQIAQGRNQIMDQVYAVPDSGYSPNDPAVYAERQAIMEASNARELNDLANSLTVNITPSAETTSAPAPTARGSLADSIAKTTTVTQEPLPTTQQKQKSNGPSRI